MKWFFAPTLGGHIQGYNDSSRAHFPLAVESTVRETLQNSLDAANDSNAVHVDIYNTDIAPSDIQGDELAKHIKASLEFCETRKQKNGIDFFTKALEILKEKSIPILAIVDSNTTGLTKDTWDSLVFEDGTTVKTMVDAPGGSYGIGKNASFIMSDLETICYSTRYHENGKTHDLFTACAKLTSHKNPDDDGYLQNVGYGMSKRDQHNSDPLKGKEIPRQDIFRLKQQGTGVFIIGIKSYKNKWEKKAKKTVLESFFTAISENSLEIRINSKIINNKNIENELNSDQKPKAYYYYHTLNNPEQTRTFENELGSFKIHFRKWDQSDKAPNSIAYVNRRGMLITKEKTRKTNPFALSDFGNLNYAIVIRANDDETDKRIRKMEPPDHNSLQINYIRADDEFNMYKHNLAELRDDIKQFLNMLTGNDNDESTVLDELDVFADAGNSGNSGNSEGRGDIISGKLEWRPVNPSDRPLRGTIPARQKGTKNGNGGKGKNDGEGDVPRKSPSPKKSSRRRQNIASRFEKLRIVHSNDKLLVAFTLHDELETKLKIHRVGEEPLDEPVLEISDCKIINSKSQHIQVHVNDNVISITSPPKDERIMLEIPTTSDYAAYKLEDVSDRTSTKTKVEKP